MNSVYKYNCTTINCRRSLLCEFFRRNSQGNAEIWNSFVIFCNVPSVRKFFVMLYVPMWFFNKTCLSLFLDIYRIKYKIWICLHVRIACKIFSSFLHTVPKLLPINKYSLWQIYSLLDYLKICHIWYFCIISENIFYNFLKFMHTHVFVAIFAIMYV